MSPKSTAGRDVANALLQTIVEVGDKSPIGGVPEGHLYAALMGVLSLDNLQGLLGLFESQGLVTRSNFLVQPTDKLKTAYLEAKADAESKKPVEGAK